MKYIYEEVNIEVIYLTDDVITTSGDDAFDGTDDGTDTWN